MGGLTSSSGLLGRLGGGVLAQSIVCGLGVGLGFGVVRGVLGALLSESDSLDDLFGCIEFGTREGSCFLVGWVTIVVGWLIGLIGQG